MKISLIASIAALAATSAIAAAPSMSTSWSDMEMSQDECIAQGTKAVRGAGMTSNFEVVGNNTIYGESGNYTGALRCAESKKIVMFIVAGPDEDRCRSLREAMATRFNNQ